MEVARFTTLTPSLKSATGRGIFAIVSLTIVCSDDKRPYYSRGCQ